MEILKDSSRLLVVGMLLLSVAFGPWVPHAHSAFEELVVGAHPSALAGAFVGLAEGPVAIFFNPAGLARAPSLAATAFYTRPFGLKELDLSTFSLSQPTRFGVLTAAVRLFGRRVYREQTYYVSWAGSLARCVSLGATAKFFHLHVDSYGTANALGLDLGLLAKLSSQVTWGVSARNLNRPRIGECMEQLPQLFATGLSLRPCASLMLMLDVHKDVRHPLQVRFGSSCRLMKPLTIRFGVQNNPSRMAFGIGFQIEPVRLDYAVYTHFDLGLSHSVSVSFFSW